MRRSDVVIVAAVCSAAAVTHGANPKNYIEARRDTPLVYVGVVDRVDEVRRAPRTLRARATVRVLSVARAVGSAPATGTVEYGSWDTRTPPFEGGWQYRLREGTMVIVFADSFSAHAPPAYVLHGEREELLGQIERLRATAAGWTPAHLDFQEISDADRRRQLKLYETIAAFLRSR